MKKNTFTFLLAMMFAVVGFSQTSATYRVTFTSNWSQDTHPHSSGNLPSNAHWSRLVGATHNEDISFYNIGETATAGIEDVAELGSNTAFFSEVNSAISNGDAFASINGAALGTAGGQVVIEEVTTTDEFPFLTLVSMIAPSPDWMIGVNGLDLLDENGEFKETISVDLYPIDAGTDNGVDYISSNSDTDPKDPVADARGASPFSNATIGTLLIERTNVLSTPENAASVISVYPNPFKDRITLTTTNATIKSIEIYNVLGKKVANISQRIGKETTMDVSNLRSGIYLLKTTDSLGNVTTKKIIKQ